MKIGTVALVIRSPQDSNLEEPELLEALSDDSEIALFENAVRNGESDPLGIIYQMRSMQEKEDNEFGDYVEELLSKPFVKPEIQQHGVEWLKSKIRIEQFRNTERDATKVIASYAYHVYLEDQKRAEFMLAGPQAKVRIRIFEVTAKAAETNRQNVA